MNATLMTASSRRAMAYPRRHRPGGPRPHVAAEARSEYAAGDQGHRPTNLREATERLEQAAREVITLLPDDATLDDATLGLIDTRGDAHAEVPSGASRDARSSSEQTPPRDPAGYQGQLAALEQVLVAMNLVQAAAVDLVGHVQRNRIAMRRVGMTLAHFLAGFTRITLHERRTYLTMSKDLLGMPNLRRALRTGRAGFGEVRSIVTAARSLEVDERADLDAMFTDDEWLGAASSDEVVDRGRSAVDAWQARRARERELRTIERRFLAVTPQLDGALTLYGELDAEAGATLLGALSAASGPPTPSADHSRNALEPGQVEPGHMEFGQGEFGQDFSALARQRADALVRIAEGFLASPTCADRESGDGRSRRRPLPRVQVVADISTLAGADAPGRLLWEAAGPRLTLTAAATRRLASDAKLQFLLTDGGEVLGISAPTPVIPAKVRAAVQARDQGCRFPGCQAPIAWCDLHHVVAREDDGPTLVDNLVALCRRHHTAVTQSTWKLDMDADATVTVRRGRRSARSRPPPGYAAGPDGPDGGSPELRTRVR